jgi:NADPH:quinone reductase-like Zn-dependent oxidoreductase
MCGTVLDSRSKRIKQGTRVMAIFNQSHLHGDIEEEDMASGLGLPLPGVLAEYRCFPAESLVVVPKYLSNEEAACLPIASVTAWTAMNWIRPIGHALGTDAHTHDGQKSILLQGTGGVAVAGAQIAKAAGLKTIITSSSDDKLKRAKDELGVDEGINYRTHWEWQDAVLKATDGKGANIVFETGGARTLRKSFGCVAFGGMISCIGYLSGKNDNDDDEDNGGDGGKTPQLHRLNVNVLALRRNVTLKGIINGSRDRFEEMVGFYEKHEIRPVVCKIFGFEEAKEALGYVKKGAHFGKVVIRVGEEEEK